MIDHLASLRPLPAFIACGLTASVYFRAEIDAPRPVETSSYCGEIDTSVEVFAVTCPDFPTFRGAENRGPRATTTAPTASRSEVGSALRVSRASVMALREEARISLWQRCRNGQRKQCGQDQFLRYRRAKRVPRASVSVAGSARHGSGSRHPQGSAGA